MEDTQGSNGLTVLVRRKKGCEDLPLPRYQSPGASGMDLHAAVEGEMVIEPGQVKLVPTGFTWPSPRGTRRNCAPAAASPSDIA